MGFNSGFKGLKTFITHQALVGWSHEGWGRQ